MPSLELLTETPRPVFVESITIPAASQTPNLASYAIVGSLTLGHLPPSATVIPGRTPCVQVLPLSVLVAQPLSTAPPPLGKRPTWNVETIVLPKASVSGSASVAC